MKGLVISGHRRGSLIDFWVRTELPKRYNENERKRGRSKSALYSEEAGDWILVADLDLTREKE